MSWDFYASDGRVKVAGVTPIAATIAGLGASPPNGANGLIRAGSTPYEYVPLIYDSTYGKWVSPAQILIASQSLNDILTNSGTGSVYTDIAVSGFPRYASIPNFKALYDAGLRPQVCVSAWMNAQAAASMFIRASIATANDGDSSGSFAQHELTGGEISVTGATDLYKTSGWADMTGSPTKAQGLLMMQYKTTSATSDARALSVGLRWVA